MYNPKSKRTSKQIGAVKKKTLDGLTANKNIDDIRALAKISNTQSSSIENIESDLSVIHSDITTINNTKQNKLTLTTDGSSGPSTLINSKLNIPDYSESLSGYVPYTGATGNVDLGEFQIKIGQVEFDQTPTGTAGVAKMRWNDQDGTVDLGLKGGNVTLQVGQEQVTRVVNKTGINLLEANYQAVRISGAQGNRLKVDLAQANNDANSAETLGIVTETINDNQEGFITTSGLVRGINTTGSIQGETWTDGDMLYLSGTVAGQLTNIKPAAPIHTVIMGYVVRAHVTQGQIYVKVDNGYELDELHNVAITTPLNDQVLQYESATSLWKNKTISTGITIGSTDITSGTVGRVLFQGTGNVVQQSSSLFWDSTNNRLGIGTSTPTNALTLGAAVAASLQSSAATIFTSNENASNVFSQVAASNDPLQRPVFAGLKSRGTLLSPTAVVAGDACTTFLSSAFDGTAGQASAALSFDAESNASSGNAPQLISFITGTSGATRTTKMQVRSNGNVLIGTTTDAGFRLDVNGTARINDTLTFTNSSFAGSFTFRINAGNTFTSASSNIGSWLQVGPSNRVFILGQEFNSTARGNVFGNTVGGEAMGIANIISQSSGTTDTVGLNIRYTINNTGSYVGTTRGIYYNPTLTSLTNTNHIAIQTVSGNVIFGSTSGNVLINTITNSGYKFDVQGTGRFFNTNTDAQIIFTPSGSNSNMFLKSQGSTLTLSVTANSFADVRQGYGAQTLRLGTSNLSGGALEFYAATNGATGGIRWYYSNSVSFIEVARMGSDGSLSVGVSGANVSSSILTADSTTKGFLPPRMTNAQMLAIATPAEGLVVYDTTNRKLCCYDGAIWQNLF